jgi:hypothetical protein
MKPYPYRIKIAIGCIIALIVFCAGALASHHYFSAPPKAPVEKWTPAKPSPQVAAIARQEIKLPAVIVYAPKAKQTLDLPDEILNDTNKYVLQATRLPSDTHPATVTTLIDQTTGEVQTYVRRELLPWFAFEHTGEARIDVGVKSAVGTVGRLTVREDMLQVKALHAGVNVSLDTDGQIFAGVGVGYRW